MRERLICLLFFYQFQSETRQTNIRPTTSSTIENSGGTKATDETFTGVNRSRRPPTLRSSSLDSKEVVAAEVAERAAEEEAD